MNPLETLNITQISEITPEMFLELAHSSIAVPFLILLFLFMAIIFLIVGLSLVREDRGKFMLIWFLAILLSGGFLLTLIFLPNFWNNILDTIKSWFQF